MTNDEEENAVRQLGDLIGYGRMMQLAEQVWRKKLKADGLLDRNNKITADGREALIQQITRES